MAFRELAFMLCAVELWLQSPSCEAGCVDSGLCCTGRDPSCSSMGWRPDRSYGSCYCDQACTSALDCCHDYQQACPAASCAVGEWSVWSGCAEACQVTYRVRMRRVVREPQNGGVPCPPLQERAACVDYWPPHRECLPSLIPALITTGGFGKARKKRDLASSEDITGYCVEFQLMSLTAGCQHTTGPHTYWMRYLHKGHIVCVECQPPAFGNQHQRCHGDGEEAERGQLLRWQSVGNARCRGSWRRLRRLESCSCPTVHSFLFI
ncbi:SBSPO protein, partial [Atractosteus spatula]|nr:SBSPO protein [Atractosteus spatula]